MRYRTAAINARVIPYCKEYREIAGSVTAAILLKQLDFYFNNSPDGFYKFLAPCDNEKYRAGDSWTEELGFGLSEFRTAFDQIGVRYDSKTAFEAASEKFELDEKRYFYCSYHDRKTGLTHYFRNHDLLDDALETLTRRPPTAPLKGGSSKSTTSIPVNAQPAFTEMHSPDLHYNEAESTTEITSEKLLLQQPKSETSSHIADPSVLATTTLGAPPAREDSNLKAIQAPSGAPVPVEEPTPHSPPPTAAPFDPLSLADPDDLFDTPIRSAAEEGRAYAQLGKNGSCGRRAKLGKFTYQEYKDYLRGQKRHRNTPEQELVGLAKYLERTGEDDDAVKDCQQAVARQNTDARIYRDLNDFGPIVCPPEAVTPGQQKQFRDKENNRRIGILKSLGAWPN